MTGAWLLVIDMQHAFGDPASAWAVSEYEIVAPRIEALIRAYSGRVVLTRYVPPEPRSGIWVPYFDRFASLALPATDAVWDLTLGNSDGCAIETRATFGKWDARMAGIIGSDSPIVICGVATECCVLATVLSAVDDGRAVSVVTDACAGATLASHQQAIGILESFAPLVTLVSTEAALESGLGADQRPDFL